MTSEPLTPSFRFPVARRLKLNREFAQVRTKGRTARGELLFLGFLEVEAKSGFRVGLVTSKRVGGAVVRNRIRRRLREIVRRHQHGIREDVWLVLVARPAAARASSARLEGEWMRLGKRAGIFADSEAE